MADQNFNVKVELNAAVTGADSLKSLTTSLNTFFNTAVKGGETLAGATQKIKEELAQARAAAEKLATGFSQAFKGDVSGGLSAGLKAASRNVATLTADLRALYAAKATGDPTKTLRDAITITERKLQEANAELATFQQLSKKAGSEGATAGRASAMGFGQFSLAMMAANLATQAITASLGAVKNAITSIVTEGMRINEFLEISRYGIATVISAQYQLRNAQGELVSGAEAYNIALKLSEEQMRKIRIAGLETAATSEELVRSFQVGMAAGAAQGITNLDTIRKITIDVTNAATAMGIAQAEVPTALRAIISGRELEENIMGRALGLTSALVREWQQEGTLVQNLNERLSQFTEGASRAAQSWAVVKSNIQESFQVFSGTVTSGLFEKLKDAASPALAGVFDTKNLGIADAYKELTNQIKTMFDGVGTVITDMIRVTMEAARQVNDWMARHKEDIAEVEGWISEIYAAWKDVWSIGIEIAKAWGETLGQLGLWKPLILAGLAPLVETLAVLKGVLWVWKEVMGIILYIGGMIVPVLLSPLKAALTAMGELGKAMGFSWGQSLVDAAYKLDVVAGHVQQIGRDLVVGKKETKAIADNFDDVAERARLAGEQAKKFASDFRDVGAGTVKSASGGVDSARFPKALNTGEAEKSAKLKEAIAKASAAAMLAITKDQLARELSDLENGQDRQLKSIQQFYAERASIQMQALKAEIKAKEAELGALPNTKDSQPERIKLESELAILRKKSGDIITENALKEDAALTQASLKIEELRVQLESLAGVQTEENIADKVSSKYNKIREELRKSFGEGTAFNEASSLIDQIINVETAKAKFALLQQEYSKAIDAMKAKEAELVQANADGKSTSYDTETQIIALHQATAVELDALIAKMDEYASKFPELIPAIQRVKQEVGTLRSSVTSDGQQMADAVENGLGNALLSLSKGTQSAGDVFRQFGLSVLEVFTQIIAKMLAAKMIFAAFRGSSGGAGGFWSGIFSSLMGKRDGGLIDGPGTGTSDSIPARLSRGEYVIRASRVKALGVGFLDWANGIASRPRYAYADGGLATGDYSSGGNSTHSFEHNISLTLDRGIILEAFDSPEGAKVSAKHVSRNPKQFNRALGGRR